MRATTLLPLFVLMAAPLAAQEPAAPDIGRFVAAAWCTVESQDEESPGYCDMGVGVALWRHKRLAWVAAVGAESVGTGIAWVALSPGSEGGPVVAVAAGIASQYSEDGIGRRPALTFGMTLSFSRGTP